MEQLKDNGASADADRALSPAATEPVVSAPVGVTIPSVEELKALAEMRDEEIDTSDIPVRLNFSNPVAGKYYRAPA
jgi:hypothetical protein